MLLQRKHFIEKEFPTGDSKTQVLERLFNRFRKSTATLPKRTTFVVFDIEATWLSRSSDITQLSAYDGKDSFKAKAFGRHISFDVSFNVYIDPRQPTIKTATDITGLSYCFQKNQMYHNGKEMESVQTSKESFLQ